MLLDAFVALCLLKIFEVNAVYALLAVGMVSLIRTCHNVNCVIGTMNEEYLEMLEKEEEEN